MTAPTGRQRRRRRKNLVDARRDLKGVVRRNGLNLPPSLVGELCVLSHGRGIRVGLVTARELARVRLLHDVSLHVLCAIARVVEPLRASFVVARVRLLPGVGPHVEFEVLQSREPPRTPGVVAAIRALPRVTPEMRYQLVAGVEGFEAAGTTRPATGVRG